MSDARTAAFEAERSALLAHAYRMLGSRALAEEVVQEAWIRFQGAEEPDSAPALLRTIVTRLSVDRLRRERVRREAYEGPWLPEPFPTPPDDPLERTERLDSVRIGLLLVLERLEPAERAVFLLREVLETPYREVAEAVDRSVVHCRQIARRARVKVRESAPEESLDPELHAGLLERLLDAMAAGDAGALEELFTRDVTLVSDGGGKAAAARRPVVGADRVTRFFLGIAGRGPAEPVLEHRRLNGVPALLVRDGDEPVVAIVLSVEPGGGIRRVFMHRNPDKLRAAEG